MKLSNKQIDMLMSMVVTAEQDDSDCDSCFEKLAEFAEFELLNRELPQALETVSVHLKQCPCCRMEFEALLQALKGLGDSGA